MNKKQRNIFWTTAVIAFIILGPLVAGGLNAKWHHTDDVLIEDVSILNVEKRASEDIYTVGFKIKNRINRTLDVQLSAILGQDVGIGGKLKKGGKVIFQSFASKMEELTLAPLMELSFDTKISVPHDAYALALGARSPPKAKVEVENVKRKKDP